MNIFLKMHLHTNKRIRTGINNVGKGENETQNTDEFHFYMAGST